MQEFMDYLIKYWGKEVANKIAAEASKCRVYMTSKEFLCHCTMCGGNWGGMFLTGIRELFPKVWDLIPDDMGMNAMVCILSVMNLCGVDTSIA